jgi:hypothetical protein
VRKKIIENSRMQKYFISHSKITFKLGNFSIKIHSQRTAEKVQQKDRNKMKIKAKLTHI